VIEDRDTLLGLWQRMTRIRRFEERASADKEADLLEGYIHNYSGQEAIATGIITQLRADDWITSTYRNHGHSIARDVPLEAMTGELMGRTTGVCGGKGGSMHAVDQDLGMIGGMGIVAGGMPIAAGAALAARRRGQDRVAVTFFGDGAVHQGAFHESMTFAALFNCPVIFVCENNLYAETTAVDYHLIAGSVVAMAEPYGVHATQVDGMDVFAVRDAAEQLIARARDTGRPALLEAMTYRYGGQYEGDTQTYKPPQEVAQWRARDPLLTFRRRVTEHGLLTDGDLDEVVERSRVEVADAFAAAALAPWPDPSALLTHVYTEIS
jgi:TPP-dependent pyruvate/acetoin dehydrogenase alpha subunit